MKKILYLTPVLFTIYPTLSLFSQNADELRLEYVWPPLLVITISALALFYLLKLALKDGPKACLLTTLLLIVFYYYGFFFNALEDWQVGNLIIGRHRYFLIIWIVFFSFIAFRLFKTKRDLLNLAKFVSLIGTSLIVLPLASLVTGEINKPKLAPPEQPLPVSQTAATEPENPQSQLPDIYYIIPDMYARSDVLEDYFSYSNQDFTDYLTARGFNIAEQSRSNYAVTFFSLAATLNLNYIDYLTDIVGPDAQDYDVPLELIEANEVISFLKTKGYTIIRSATNYRVKDINLEFGSLPTAEFYRLLVDSTILRVLPVRQNLINNQLNQILRLSTLEVFEKFFEIPVIAGPKFVLVHLAIPHWPYLFGSEGEPRAAKFRDTEVIDADQERELYLGQLIFSNSKLKEMVEQILTESDKPPIIILQSDHGFNTQISDIIEADNKPRVATENFSAYYLPGKDPSVLPEDMSAVNTFRFIFNEYFGTDYELLENKNYLDNKKQPYVFIEVD